MHYVNCITVSNDCNSVSYLFNIDSLMTHFFSFFMNFIHLYSSSLVLPIFFQPETICKQPEIDSVFRLCFFSSL
jgi:hypothetical protein